MVWRQLFAVVGSARLFEEASFAVGHVERDMSIQRGFEAVVKKSLEGSLGTQHLAMLAQLVRIFFSEFERFSDLALFREPHFTTNQPRLSSIIRWELFSTPPTGPLDSPPPLCE